MGGRIGAGGGFIDKFRMLTRYFEILLRTPFNTANHAEIGWPNLMVVHVAAGAVEGLYYITASYLSCFLLKCPRDF